MTPTDLRILSAFPPPPGEVYGLDLIERTGLGAGRFYPSIANLEAADLIASRFEGEHYPRRRMYHLTPDGLRRRFEECQSAPAGWPALEGR